MRKRFESSQTHELFPSNSKVINWPVTKDKSSIQILIRSQYAVVRNAHFHHQDHLDSVKHLINVYLLINN